MLQPQRCLPDVAARLRGRQRTGLHHQPLQVHPGDVLQGQEGCPAPFEDAGVVDSHDVRVSQAGSSAGLALEAVQGLRRAEQGGADQLEDLDPVQAKVPHLEHATHAALAEQLQHDILSQEQLFGAALPQPVGLVGGEPVAAHQLADQDSAIPHPR